MLQVHWGVGVPVYSEILSESNLKGFNWKGDSLNRKVDNIDIPPFPTHQFPYVERYNYNYIYGEYGLNEISYVERIEGEESYVYEIY